jgi:hypothetical protein
MNKRQELEHISSALMRLLAELAAFMDQDELPSPSKHVYEPPKLSPLDGRKTPLARMWADIHRLDRQLQQRAELTDLVQEIEDRRKADVALSERIDFEIQQRATVGKLEHETNERRANFVELDARLKVLEQAHFAPKS